jgi:hypothetical protein
MTWGLLDTRGACRDQLYAAAVVTRAGPHTVGRFGSLSTLLCWHDVAFIVYYLVFPLW